MALKAKSEKRYSVAEYLAFEDRSERRHEFDTGIVTAMAGGSDSHAAVISILIRVIGNRIGGDCRVFGSDLRVHVEESARFFYPDVLVVCGKPQLFEKRNDTVTNPVLVVEVLSKKTEARDRGEKMLSYRGLESLREYVLISQENPIVEQFIRKADGAWEHRATIGIRSSVHFESIGVGMELAEIYSRIEFSK